MDGLRGRRQVLGVRDLLAPRGLAAASAGASYIVRWVMKWSGAAPCQCHSPGGVWIVSPGRISRTLAAARLDVSPSPSRTCRVWPTAWTCQALRAPGAKRTMLERTRDGASPRAMRSNQASPVNVSGGPLVVGWLGQESHEASLFPLDTGMLTLSAA